MSPPSPGQEKEVGVGRRGKESAPVLLWTVSVSLYIIYRLELRARVYEVTTGPRHTFTH